MLENYFKVIFRNFNRDKYYTSINVVGLAIGYAAFMLIAIYVYFEISFENIHLKANRIYRPTYIYNSGNEFKSHWARIPENYINELPNEFPEIEKLIRFQNHEQKYVRVGEAKFRPEHAYLTDNAVFDVLDLTLLSGNPKNALTEPYSIVITASLAKKYFGRIDVLGEDIFVTGDWTSEEVRHKITGVLKDIPRNTHLPIDMLISFKNEEERTGWAYVYILLKEGASIEGIKNKIPGFIQKYSDESSAGKVSFEFQSLLDIHLHSDLAREITPNGNIFYVRIFTGIGFFILFIALANYVNLNSVMFLDRSKELGLRKILGADKTQIAVYLFIESIAYNLLALSLGAFICYLSFPYFSSLTTIEFNINVFLFTLFMIAIACIYGIIAGTYPVTRLNAINPVEIVKNSGTFRFTKRGGKISVKRILVTWQFCISILLIGSAFVAMDQFHFLNTTNLGIEKEQILAIPAIPDKIKDEYKILKDRLKTIPGVIEVAGCMEVPSREIRDAGPVLVKGINEDAEKAPTMDIQIIDHDFINLLGVKLIAGNNIPQSLMFDPIPEFTENFTYYDYLYSKRRVYIINSTAMKQLGWETPDEALGQEISFSIGGFNLAMGPIIGIVADYHQESLKNRIDPTIMVFEPIWMKTVLIKIETEHVQGTIANIKSTWNELFPTYPIEYHFLDDMYEELYKNDRVKLQLLYVMSGLAICIAFIGLFGLIAYSLKTRVKEMAIRKVIGADVLSLIKMIFKEYIGSLAIAAIIAIPISYYFMDSWLQNFAYKEGIAFSRYALTFLVIVATALFIISLQTIKAISDNPAETLRRE